jgi:hypothetical protein
MFVGKPDVLLDVIHSPELLESARNNPRVALRPERLLLELLASGHATTSGISSSACLRF